MMDRRRFVALIGGALAAALTRAQPARPIPRVGFVLSTAPLQSMQGAEPAEPVMRGFLQGLRELGYVEGQNIVIERRTAEGRPERLANLIRGLADAGVAVIVVTGNQMVQRAMEVTTTIPIVAAGMADPVRTGFARSLANPGGNLTGVIPHPGVPGVKRLELIKELVPAASRIAMLAQRVDWNLATVDDLRAEAAKRDLTVYLAEVRMPDLDAAFAALARDRPDAVIVSAAPPFFVHRKRVVDSLAKIGVPDIHSFHQAVEAGALASYGHDSFEIFRRTARYVDRILKGTKAGDLAIEQIESYSFVINLKAAKRLGLTVPQTILLRADRVIE